MTLTRIVLSGSTSGRVIPVVQIITPGTLIHTAHATSLDAVYLWATNGTEETATLTLEWGGVLNPGDQICRQVPIRPHQPPRPILTGQILTGSLVLRAFSSLASALEVGGFVTRIS